MTNTVFILWAMIAYGNGMAGAATAEYTHLKACEQAGSALEQKWPRRVEWVCTFKHREKLNRLSSSQGEGGGSTRAIHQGPLGGFPV